MTGGAVVFEHGRMGHLVKDPLAVGAMRAMAIAAARFGHRIVQVLAFETLRICFMTFEAQRPRFAFEQVVLFLGGMRLVAAQAPFIRAYRPVFEAGIAALLSDIGVAFKTQLVSGFQKIRPILGTVRIVALLAIAGRDNVVHAVSTFRKYIGVALQTEPSGSGLQ